MPTCRFCKELIAEDRRGYVKYGTRHYAHHRCYLDAGKSLSDLAAWQVGNFPYRLLKERGLEAEASRLVQGEVIWSGNDWPTEVKP